MNDTLLYYEVSHLLTSRFGSPKNKIIDHNVMKFATDIPGLIKVR